MGKRKKTFSACGTLRWYWLDSDDGAYGGMDCLSESLARDLAKVMVLASERPIYKFEWITTSDDMREISISW